ncbi:MAG: hypothetical protein GWP08_01575 [Nitrospiraceae bacterium]|nr:hypothetical protein [Nitrospiraceae bacterium]
MASDWKTTLFTGQRQAWRYDYAGMLRYHCGSENLGTATWCDVSTRGARIHLGRYLGPGRQIAITFDFLNPMAQAQPVGEYAGPLTLRAEVVWCRPAPNGVEFQAGLRFAVPQDDMGFGRGALLDMILAHRAANRESDADTCSESPTRPPGSVKTGASLVA